MLSTALAPVPRNGADSIGEVAEAFNLSALGAYPTAAVTSRCLQSFQRAYGFANCKVRPKAVDGTPGWCIAFYPDQSPPAAVIAIAGINTLSDLLNWIGNRFAINLTGTTTKVNQQLSLWADAILAVLSTDADWINFRSNRRMTLRIGGFSAGAGIAELIAAKLKIANPGWNPVVFKFGSPKVGAFGWPRWCEDNLSRANWYVYGDPIRAFPAALVRPISLSEGIPGPGPGQFVRMYEDISAESLTPDGELGNGMPALSSLDQIRVLAQLTNYSDFTTDPYDPPNRWWLHARTTYRWCLQQYLRRNSAIDFTRMLGLEYPNENQWNALWAGAQTVTPEMLTIADPPPADEIVPPNMIQQASDLAGGEGGGGEWGEGDFPGGDGGGGDWGQNNPSQSRGIRVRLRR